MVSTLCGKSSHASPHVLPSTWDFCLLSFICYIIAPWPFFCIKTGTMERIRSAFQSMVSFKKHISLCIFCLIFSFYTWAHVDYVGPPAGGIRGPHCSHSSVLLFRLPADEEWAVQQVHAAAVWEQREAHRSQPVRLRCGWRCRGARFAQL